MTHTDRLSLSLHSLTKEAVAAVAGAVGRAALSHAKSWVPRMWGTASKALGAGLEAATTAGGKTHAAGKWLRAQGESTAAYGSKQLNASRNQLWNGISKTPENQTAVREAVRKKITEYGTANPGLKPTEEMTSKFVHDARKATGGGYNWGGKALGTGVVGGGIIGAEALAEQAEKIPYAGRVLAPAIRYGVNGPAQLAIDAVPKLLDPGARAGGLDAAAQFVDRARNMTAMERLAFLMNPDVINQELPPEVLEHIAKMKGPAEAARSGVPEAVRSGILPRNEASRMRSVANPS